MFLLLLFPSYNWCRCLQQFPHQKDLNINERNEIEDENFRIEINKNLSAEFSNSQKIDNMLEKAVLKIMTGNLTKSDIQLLKSLNYSSNEIFEFRENQKTRKKAELHKICKTKALNSMNDTLLSSLERNRIYESKEIEFEEYNRRAVYDYENMVAEFEIDESSVDDVIKKETFQDIYQNGNKVMNSEIILKLRYDSSFSSEKSQSLMKNGSEIQIDEAINKDSKNNLILSKGSCKFFQEHNSSIIDLCSLVNYINILKINVTNSWNDINLSLTSQDLSKENNLKEILHKYLISTFYNSNFENQVQNISKTFGNWMENSNHGNKRERLNLEDENDDYNSTNVQNIITNICHQYKNLYYKIMDESGYISEEVDAT